MRQFYILVLILYLANLSFAQSYQDLWVGGNIYSLEGDGSQKRNYGMFKNLLYIDADSITNLNLRSASVEDSLFRYKHPYELRDKKFYRNVELLDEVNQLELVNKDTLILQMPDNPFYFVYQRAERYEKATQKEQLYQDLTQHGYTMQSDIFEEYYNNDFEIRFSPTGYFFTDQLNPYISQHPYWFLTAFEGELFLVLGKGNFFIQIHFFDKEAIYGTLHPYNELIQLNRIEPAPPQLKEPLLGKWKKQDTEEYLILTEYEAKHIKNNEVLGGTWLLTRNGKMMLFPELGDNPQERQWEIVDIQGNMMTVVKRGESRKDRAVFLYYKQ